MNKPQLSTKTLLFIVLLIFANLSLKASECYHYHTATEYNLLKADGHLYLETTVKDPNKISIVDYQKVLLKGVFPGDAIIFDETQDAIIIKNNIWYYYISKSSLYDSSVLIDHLLEVQTQTAPPIGLIFFMNSSWNKLNYNTGYTTRAERVQFVPVKNIPPDGILLASYFSGSNPIHLVKDQKKVYSYDESTGEVEILENLNPHTAKIDTLDANSDELCIYDGRYFYMTRDNFRTVEDMTPQFKNMNLKQSFLNLKFHQPNSFRTYLDFQDGSLWSYVSAGISLNEGGEVNFYKVENSKYLEASGLVLHKGFLYDDPWDLANEVQPIHLPKTENIEDYTLTIDGRYRNGGNLYKIRDLNDGSRILEKVENAEIVANDAVRIHNNSLWSYRNATSHFYLTPDSIEFYNYDTQKIERSIKHRSALKDLTLAFAFDNKLLIENSVIPSIADYESIEFLGSTVEVKSPCDGGQGQIEIVVDYNYYFKDKNSVYKYHTGDKGLVKVNDREAGTNTKDNFKTNFGRMITKIKIFKTNAEN